MTKSNVKNIQVRLNIDKEEGKQIYKHLKNKNSMNLYIQDLILRDLSGEKKENIPTNSTNVSNVEELIKDNLSLLHEEETKRLSELEKRILNKLPDIDGFEKIMDDYLWKCAEVLSKSLSDVIKIERENSASLTANTKLLMKLINNKKSFWPFKK